MCTVAGCVGGIASDKIGTFNDITIPVLTDSIYRIYQPYSDQVSERLRFLRKVDATEMTPESEIP